MSRPDDTRSPRGNPPGTWPRGQEPQWPEPGHDPRADHRAEPRWDNEPQYHYPAGQQDQGYAQQGAAPQGFDYAAGPPPASTGEPAYAPRFGRYAPAGQREAHGAPPAQHYDDQNHGYVPPQQWNGAEHGQARPHDDGLSRFPSQQQASAGFGYAGDAHGQQGMSQQGHWQHGDQPAYDRGYGAQPGYGQPAPDPYAHQHAQGYQQADPYAQQGYGQQHGYQDPSFGPAQYDQQGDAQGEYGDEYEDEPPRRRRGLLVAGALLGAVAIGGGLAFVYKTFGQGGKRGGPTPLIARSEKPTKVAPSETQGKQFENASKKIMARVGEAPPPQAPAAAAPPAPAVPGLIVSPPPGAEPARESAVASASEATPTTRRVQTVPIGADGQPAPRPQVDSRPSQAIPGVSLDNTLNPPNGIRGPIATAPAAAPPAAPRRVASAAPAETAVAPIAAPPPARTPERRVASRTPAAAPSEPAPARASGGSGYVVVLSSQKDPMAALRVFADLQQKYPGPLSGRKAEVQEANLGEKGVWQRLVVGPPASRQSANELCAKLKSAGYKDCWTKRY